MALESSKLVLTWLNDELNLDPKVEDIVTEFSNGYRFAEVLYVLKELKFEEFKEFRNSSQIVDKKINFSRLKTLFQDRLNLSISTQEFNEIMKEHLTKATVVLYKIRNSLFKKKINLNGIKVTLNEEDDNEKQRKINELMDMEFMDEEMEKDLLMDIENNPNLTSSNNNNTNFTKANLSKNSRYDKALSPSNQGLGKFTKSSQISRGFPKIKIIGINNGEGKSSLEEIQENQKDNQDNQKDSKEAENQKNQGTTPIRIKKTKNLNVNIKNLPILNSSSVEYGGRKKKFLAPLTTKSQFLSTQSYYNNSTNYNNNNNKIPLSTQNSLLSSESQMQFGNGTLSTAVPNKFEMTQFNETLFHLGMMDLKEKFKNSNSEYQNFLALTDVEKIREELRKKFNIKKEETHKKQEKIKKELKINLYEIKEIDFIKRDKNPLYEHKKSINTCLVDNNKYLTFPKRLKYCNNWDFYCKQRNLENKIKEFKKMIKNEEKKTNEDIKQSQKKYPQEDENENKEMIPFDKEKYFYEMNKLNHDEFAVIHEQKRKKYFTDYPLIKETMNQIFDVAFEFFLFKEENIEDLIDVKTFAKINELFIYNKPMREREIDTEMREIKENNDEYKAINIDTLVLNENEENSKQDYINYIGIWDDDKTVDNDLRGIKLDFREINKEAPPEYEPTEKELEDLTFPTTNVDNYILGDAILDIIDSKFSNKNKEILGGGVNLPTSGTSGSLGGGSKWEHIPYKVALVGYPFCGKTLICDELNKKYANIKIYSVQKMLRDAYNQYKTITEPIENNPKFKSMKPNQVEQLRQEQQAKLKEFEPTQILIQSYIDSMEQKDENENKDENNKTEINKPKSVANDEVLMNLLIKRVETDFPKRPEEEITNELVEYQKKIYNLQKEIDNLKKQKLENKKPNPKDDMLITNMEQQIETIRLTSFKGFILVDFPTNINQCTKLENYLTGYIDETQKPKTEKNVLIEKLGNFIDFNLSPNENNTIKKAGLDFVVNIISKEKEINEKFDTKKYDPYTDKIYSQLELKNNTDKKLLERLVDNVPFLPKEVFEYYKQEYNDNISKMSLFYNTFGMTIKHDNNTNNIINNLEGNNFLNGDIRSEEIVRVYQYIDPEENEVKENNNENNNNEVNDNKKKNNNTQKTLSPNEKEEQKNNKIIEFISKTIFDCLFKEKDKKEKLIFYSKHPEYNDDDEEKDEIKFSPEFDDNNNNNNINNPNNPNNINNANAPNKKSLNLSRILKDKSLKLASENFETVVNDLSSFGSEYFKKVGGFIHMTNKQKNDIHKRLNLIQRKFRDFLNYQTEKKKIIRRYCAKYNNFFTEYPELFRSQKVIDEFSSDIEELNNNLWILINIKQKISINELNDIKGSNFIEFEIKKFYENIKDLFLLETKKFLIMADSIFHLFSPNSNSSHINRKIIDDNVSISTVSGNNNPNRENRDSLVINNNSSNNINNEFNSSKKDILLKLNLLGIKDINRDNKENKDKDKNNDNKKKKYPEEILKGLTPILKENIIETNNKDKDIDKKNNNTSHSNYNSINNSLNNTKSSLLKQSTNGPFTLTTNDIIYKNIDLLFNNCVLLILEENDKRTDNFFKMIKELMTVPFKKTMKFKKKKGNDESFATSFSSGFVGLREGGMALEENVRKMLQNEKNKFKYRISFIKSYAIKYIKIINETAKMIYNNADDWIVKSVSLQNDALNLVIKTLKEILQSKRLINENTDICNIEMDTFEKVVDDNTDINQNNSNINNTNNTNINMNNSNVTANANNTQNNINENTSKSIIQIKPIDNSSVINPVRVYNKLNIDYLINDSFSDIKIEEKNDSQIYIYRGKKIQKKITRLILPLASQIANEIEANPNSSLNINNMNMNLDASLNKSLKIVNKVNDEDFFYNINKYQNLYNKIKKFEIKENVVSEGILNEVFIKKYIINKYKLIEDLFDNENQGMNMDHLVGCSNMNMDNNRLLTDRTNNNNNKKGNEKLPLPTICNALKTLNTKKIKKLLALYQIIVERPDKEKEENSNDNNNTDEEKKEGENKETIENNNNTNNNNEKNVENKDNKENKDINTQDKDKDINEKKEEGDVTAREIKEKENNSTKKIEYDNYINIAELFTVISLIGTKLLSQDVEEKIVSDLNDKLIQGRFLPKNDFLEYSFWFEQDFDFSSKENKTNFVNNSNNNLSKSLGKNGINKKNNENVENNENPECKEKNIKEFLFSVWKDDKGLNFNLKEFLNVLKITKYITKLEDYSGLKYYDIIFNDEQI